jgi:hypothetical protein
MKQGAGSEEFFLPTSGAGKSQNMIGYKINSEYHLRV